MINAVYTQWSTDWIGKRVLLTSINFPPNVKPLFCLNSSCQYMFTFVARPCNLQTTQEAMMLLIAPPPHPPTNS